MGSRATALSRTWPSRLARPLVAAGISALLGTFGCTASAHLAETPEASVLAFARALTDGQLDAAYAMMSEDYRKRVSIEQWRRQLGENPVELAETSAALSHVEGTSHGQGVVHYGDDGEVRLQKSGERWLIASDLLTFYDQSTPRAALRAFVQAMERKRYDIVMRLIPEADKEGMTTDTMETAWSGPAHDEVERMLAGLRDHQDDPIEVTDQHASLPYGDRKCVRFLREHGVWKIEDPE